MTQPLSILLLGGTGKEAARLQRALAPHFLLVEHAHSLEDARELMRRCQYHRLLVIDPPEPWETLHPALEQSIGLPAEILLIADRDQAATALDALRGGASDVLLRPFSNEELVTALSTSVGTHSPEPAHRASHEGHRLVGETPSMQAVRALVERIAPTRATVLVQGETGTGKELIARLLHERSGRSGPFVPINCSAIAPDLLESELFGHGRGTFTSALRRREGLFVAAAGGTLFLDEIDEMAQEMQAKLLRTLEEDTIRPVGTDHEVPVDCRIVASTATSLAERVAQRRFREDLYYRLNVIRIEVPPLRERGPDIPLLAAHFIDTLSAETGIAPVELEPGHLAELENHDWPGNVRELRNLAERTLLLGSLPSESVNRPGPERDHAAGTPDYPLDWTLEQVKHHHMLRVLEAAGGNKSAAARRLAVSRRTLERKLGTTRRD